jgi:predicted nucleotidyltransferase
MTLYHHAMTGGYEMLWARRHDILQMAARYGAHHVRVPSWAAEPFEEPPGELDLVVSFDGSRSLLDHAALQLEIGAILGGPVNVVNDGGLGAEERERLLREYVPF